MVQKPKIVDRSLEFHFTGNPRNRSRTDYIVIHHTVSQDVSVKTVDQWHKERGWAGIGYHFLIRTDGTIERGRKLEWHGVHTSEVNSVSLGVAITGNLEIHEATTRQYQALAKLINWLQSEYPHAKITGHKDHSNTACPGKYFDWGKLTQKMEAELGSETLDWEQEQAIQMIEILTERGWIHNPAYHIETIKAGEPLGDYVWLSLFERISREK